MGIAYDSDTLEMVENLESNSSIEKDEEVVEVVPPRFLEDEIGPFFVQPFIGLSLITGDTNIGNDTVFRGIESDLGYNIRIKRWEEGGETLRVKLISGMYEILFNDAKVNTDLFTLMEIWKQRDLVQN